MREEDIVKQKVPVVVKAPLAGRAGGDARGVVRIIERLIPERLKSVLPSHGSRIIWEIASLRPARHAGSFGNGLAAPSQTRRNDRATGNPIRLALIEIGQPGLKVIPHVEVDVDGTGDVGARRGVMESSCH